MAGTERRTERRTSRSRRPDRREQPGRDRRRSGTGNASSDRRDRRRRSPGLEQEAEKKPRTAFLDRPVQKRRRKGPTAPRQRHVRNRARFNTLFGALAAVIILAAVAVGSIIFFKVDTVQVEGLTAYEEQEVIDSSEVQLGENLFLLKRKEISQRLEEKLPYLKKVTVGRSLPGTVTIKVVECEPCAVIAVSNGFWYVDEEGKLLELREENEGYPVITGISLLAPSAGTTLEVDSAYRTRQTSLVALLGALKEQDLLADVVSINLSDGSQVIMQYAGLYTVKVPYGSDFSYKMRAMKGIIDELANENYTGSGTIDLTLEDEWHFIPD